MSRMLSRDNTEEIWDLDQCKYLLNDVCVNHKSEMLGDFPICYGEDYCSQCELFEKEDGVIDD